MELTQLLQFKTIAECKTMTEAAERLHVSQPALSVGLKKLEEELGVQLFERQKNRIVLNKAGELALTHAGAVLGRAEEMKNAFRQYVEKNNAVFLGFCDPGPMRFSVPLLQQAYPNLNLSAEVVLDDGYMLSDLLSKKYDAVISLKKLEHKEVVSIPFAKESLMLSIPEGDPLAQKTSICLRNFQNREFAAYCIYGAFEREIKKFLDWLFSLPKVTIYTDYFVFRQMLEHKKVLSFTTRLVQLYRNDGKRVIVPLEDGGVSAIYWLSYLKKDEYRLVPLLSWHRDNALMLLGTETLQL